MYPLVVYSWSPEREQLELCKGTVPHTGGRLSWNKGMSQAEKSGPHGSAVVQERERVVMLHGPGSVSPRDGCGSKERCGDKSGPRDLESRV